MAQNPNSDNSGMGVIVGILVAVLFVIGGYFFVQGRDTVADGTGTTANIEAPTPDAAEPAAGNPEPTPAPAPTPAQ